MRKRISLLLAVVLDLVLPPRRTERLVRALSLGELQMLTLPDAEPGLLPYHDERVSALVWEAKYYKSPRALALAGALLGEVLADIASDELGQLLLVPLPMHPRKRRERGHNQTELLAQAALAALGSGIVAYAPAALARTKDTVRQNGLPRHTRLRNVRGSMRADPALVRGRVCVVLDDVTTTGATLAEAERALTRAGARRVYLLALARS